MSLNQSTVAIATDIETWVHTLAKSGDEAFVISSALFISILHGADYSDVEAMAAGDEDALDAFIDCKEIGTFVADHITDTFQELAQTELDERNENSKDAWETEMEYREMVGAL